MRLLRRTPSNETSVTVRRKWLLLGLVAGLGSFARGCIPDLDNQSCAIQCDDRCPPQLECRAGFCVRPGFEGVCAPFEPPGADAGTRDAGAPSPGDAVATGEEREPDPCAPSDTGLRVEPCPLPPPCAGITYAIQLSVSGGVAPYAWYETRLPEGLALSPDGVVSGVPRASGALSLRVRDAVGAEHVLRHELVARDRCWFAYVDAGERDAALQLFDPMLSEPGQGPRLPRTAATGSALDFSFSPDGRWLALRLRGADDVDRLALYSAPAWQERVLELPGSVLQYSWSRAEAGALAVALRDGDTTYLSAVLTRPSGDEAPMQELALLPPVAAPIDSALVWLADDRLVFHGPTEPGAVTDHRLYSAPLGAEGFGEVSSDLGSSFLIDGSGRLRLEPVPGGVAVVYSYPGSPNLMMAYSLSTAGFRRFTHAAEVIWSPDGRHTARVSDGDVLEVYRALGEPGDDVRVRVSPFATSPGCARLLAWSPEGTRIACAAPAGSQDRIIVFSLDTASGALAAAPIEGSFVYDAEAAVFRRRAFSPDGSWLAFTTDVNLYLADLTGSRFTVERGAQPLLSLATGAELAFSPDGRWLLRHQGPNLWLQALSVDQQAASLPASTRSAATCQETEGESRQAWCGASGSSAGVAWSPDSRFAAYVSAPDQLLLVAPGADQIRLNCATSCGGHVFQP